MFGYTAIANPDLKPETSDGLELGVRYVGDAVYASLSAYDNRYQAFIESFAFVCFNDAGLMVFQSPNVSDARRSAEHTSALQSLIRISSAVFCYKKNTTQKYTPY